MRRLASRRRVYILLSCTAAVALLDLVLQAAATGQAWADTGYGVAPYVDMSNSAEHSLDTAIGQAGISAFTAAFITGSGCAPIWGDSQGLDNSVATSEIARARSEGARVIVAFGGMAGAELSQSCIDLGALTAAYQSVIDTYRVNHLDFDVEGAAIADPASIRRRFQAIDALEQHNPNLVVSLTIPVVQSGPDVNGQAFLRATRDNGTRVDLVNAMTMDYGTPGVQMGDAAISAATGTLNAVRQVWPNDGWANIGITPMIGQNDTAGEVFTLDDAHKVVDFAQAHGVGRLAFWSIGRDQPCGAGTGGAASAVCSAIGQGNLEFTRTFATYRGGNGQPPPQSNLVAPPAPSGTPGTPTPPPAPSGTPGTPPTSVQEWQPGTGYATGQQVTYGGHTYRCLQGHTAQSNWDPPDVPALWQLVN